MKKTKKLMVGIISGMTAVGLGGCSEDLPPKPQDTSCNDWEWDYDDGVYECDDNSSSHYGHAYYGGSYYSNKSSLYKSSSFKSYKASSSFKGGFGSGSKSFGG